MYNTSYPEGDHHFCPPPQHTSPPTPPSTTRTHHCSYWSLLTHRSFSNPWFTTSSLIRESNTSLNHLNRTQVNHLLPDKGVKKTCEPPCKSLELTLRDSRGFQSRNSRTQSRLINAMASLFPKWLTTDFVFTNITFMFYKSFISRFIRHKLLLFLT